MSDADKTDRGESLRHRLERFGDAHKSIGWERGKTDYVAALNLTAADIPELLTVAREWTQERKWPTDENDVSGYAPIHAWRCLAQLSATEAIEPLLGMLDPLEAGNDDWSPDEFPHVFAWIGPAAIPALRGYLADTSHGLYARACTADSIREIAQRHLHTRAEVVGILSDALSRYAENDGQLNGFLVGHLLDLKATEAAEVIERAYAADQVELALCGNWNEVREQLGVEGLGLVPEDLASASYSLFPSLMPMLSGSLMPPLLAPIPAHHPKHQKDLRAKRKRQRQDRKRNRKR